MSDSVISSRYAQALFNSALAEGNIQAVQNDLKDLQDVFRKTRLKGVLDNPHFPIKKKVNVIKEIGKKFSSKISGKFLLLLMKKTRIFLLNDIKRRFDDLALSHDGIVPCVVYLAKEPNAEFRQAIIDGLRRITHSEVDLTTQVDSSAIGGIGIKIGNKILDARIRTRLNLIRRQMLQTSLS